MVLLAIWLFLIGYSIAITGKRNLGLSYQPQADGSIKAVDGQGNPGQQYSLMDVIQCQEPSVNLQGQPAPLGAASSSRRAGTPPPLSNPIPRLGPLPLPEPFPVPAIERIPVRLPRPPAPGPIGIPGLEGVLALERSLEQDVYRGVSGLTHWLNGATGGIRLPQLPQLPRPRL